MKIERKYMYFEKLFTLHKYKENGYYFEDSILKNIICLMYMEKNTEIFAQKDSVIARNIIKTIKNDLHFHAYEQISLCIIEINYYNFECIDTKMESNELKKIKKIYNTLKNYDNLELYRMVYAKF